jgi:hypothetical protein
MRTLRGTFWEWRYQVSHRIQRVCCWFTGHKETWGSQYDREPDYCERCFLEWPQEASTLPKYLNRWYCWMVEREWHWFEKLDLWLLGRPGWLPSWWEY